MGWQRRYQSEADDVLDSLLGSSGAQRWRLMFAPVLLPVALIVYGYLCLSEPVPEGRTRPLITGAVALLTGAGAIAAGIAAYCYPSNSAEAIVAYAILLVTAIIGTGFLIVRVLHNI